MQNLWLDAICVHNYHYPIYIHTPKNILLGCISKWQQDTLHVLLDNDYSIRVCQSFVAIFKNIPYYAGIMLNAFIDLLCSKLCWHNRLVF